MTRRKNWLLFGPPVIVLLLIAIIWMSRQAEAQPANGNHSSTANGVPVQVVKPSVGGLERTTIQPASVQSFEWVDEFAQVSGLLEKQEVDIGSKVKKGQLLAHILAPELVKEQAHAVAGLEQAKAQHLQAQKHVNAAAADVESAKKLVKQRDFEKDSKVSYYDFRKKTLKRYKALVLENVIDEALVDEENDRCDAAKSAMDAAIAAVDTANFDVETKKAKLEQAIADVAAAKANVLVAEATLGKADVYVNFTEITSPFDGIITRRNFNNGAFIRGADRSGQLPLLTIKRTDLMRVSVQVPDTDVPFLAVGNSVVLKISTLGSKGIFPGKVSRLADSQDEKSLTMRAEVDLVNKDSILRDGMYGEMTIYLKSTLKHVFTLPSSYIRSDADGKQRFVYVARKKNDKHFARKVPVRIGFDNADQAEILSGLAAGDLVICDPSSAIVNGTRVEIIDTPKE